MTSNTSNQVAWSAPAGYNASEWIALTRYLDACSADPGCQLGFPSCNMGALPGHKVDANNCGGFSTDFIGGSNGYAEASFAGRAAIWNAHLDYTKGLMWTMANSTIPAVKVRSVCALCAHARARAAGDQPATVCSCTLRLSPLPCASSSRIGRNGEVGPLCRRVSRV